MAAAAAGRLRSPRWAAALAGLLCLIVLAAAFALSRRQPTRPAPAFPAGEIVIGIDAGMPPFAIDSGGTLSGLDIDLAHALGREIGLPVRFVNIGYYGLYDALISGRVDLLIAALPIDPARTSDVRYSQPYFDNGLVYVTQAGSPFSEFAALSGQRIAYEFGGRAAAELRRQERRIGPVQHFPYELPQYALDALRLEQVDAVLVDAVTHRLYRRQHPHWAGQADYHYLTHENYVMALRIDRRAAAERVDAALLALKESGELATITADWL